MHRYFVTGTDTDVGKTRVTAAVARALQNDQLGVTIVKIAQTGVSNGDAGDAQRAGELAGVPWRELARFAAPADPWSAAIAEARNPLAAAELADAIAAIPGAVVAEGAGGALVPLNERESISDVAALAELEAILVVGLRLGCINHALLTAQALAAARVPVAGAILCDRFEATPAAYKADVVRALQGKCRILGILEFDEDERRSVRAATKLFRPFLQKEHS